MPLITIHEWCELTLPFLVQSVFSLEKHLGGALNMSSQPNCIPQLFTMDINPCLPITNTFRVPSYC